MNSSGLERTARPPVKVWRYYLPNEDPSLSGWAEIVIASSGFFAAVSDYGNYSYAWRDSGCSDVRKFFLNSRCDWTYFASKLGRRSYDGEATARAIRNHILEQRRAKEMTAEEARSEWDIIGSDVEENIVGFHDWCRETKIDAPWELGCEAFGGQLEHFCKVTMKRLSDAIAAELAAEAGAAASKGAA